MYFPTHIVGAKSSKTHSLFQCVPTIYGGPCPPPNQKTPTKLTNVNHLTSKTNCINAKILWLNLGHIILFTLSSHFLVFFFGWIRKNLWLRVCSKLNTKNIVRVDSQLLELLISQGPLIGFFLKFKHVISFYKSYCKKQKLESQIGGKQTKVQSWSCSKLATLKTYWSHTLTNKGTTIQTRAHWGPTF